MGSIVSKFFNDALNGESFFYAWINVRKEVGNKSSFIILNWLYVCINITFGTEWNTWDELFGCLLIFYKEFGEGGIFLGYILMKSIIL